MHTPSSMLKTSIKRPSKKDVIKNFSDYLTYNGIDKTISKSLVAWIENNKEKISSLNEKQLE